VVIRGVADAILGLGVHHRARRFVADIESAGDAVVERWGGSDYASVLVGQRGAGVARGDAVAEEAILTVLVHLAEVREAHAIAPLTEVARESAVGVDPTLSLLEVFGVGHHAA
jgi:hypothetical protein